MPSHYYFSLPPPRILRPSYGPVLHIEGEQDESLSHIHGEICFLGKFPQYCSSTYLDDINAF